MAFSPPEYTEYIIIFSTWYVCSDMKIFSIRIRWVGLCLCCARPSLAETVTAFLLDISTSRNSFVMFRCVRKHVYFPIKYSGFDMWVRVPKGGFHIVWQQISPKLLEIFQRICPHLTPSHFPCIRQHLHCAINTKEMGVSRWQDQKIAFVARYICTILTSLCDAGAWAKRTQVIKLSYRPDRMLSVDFTWHRSGFGATEHMCWRIQNTW